MILATCMALAATFGLSVPAMAIVIPPLPLCSFSDVSPTAIKCFAQKGAVTPSDLQSNWGLEATLLQTYNIGKGNETAYNPQISVAGLPGNTGSMKIEFDPSVGFVGGEFALVLGAAGDESRAYMLNLQSCLVGDVCYLSSWRVPNGNELKEVALYGDYAVSANSAIPVPATSLLLASALGGLGWFARRRKTS